ncbi:MAG TPA: metallophosphoesterase family protein [Gemmatimonadaceae bacterium]|nr:metallophosphoesterase family protein [Gemmatimonadaceae bacterium]
MTAKRVAALYDIHGNLPALEAVLAEVRQAGVTEIVIGGDVGPGPMPRAALEHLLQLDAPVHFIQGNGERELLVRMNGVLSDAIPESHREVIRWSAEDLRPHRESIATWPATLQLHIPTLGDVLFCHATPRNDTEVFTRITAEERLLPVFAAVRASIVVCGHTHMQFDRMVGSTRVVNAGSVGMSFQGTGAYWLLLGTELELRRTAYDLERGAERILATAYPDAQRFVADYVLQTPDERTILETFSRVELQ